MVKERPRPAPQPIVIVVPERKAEPVPVSNPAPHTQTVVDSEPRKVKGGGQAIRTGDFLFKLSSCVKTDTDVNCELTVINNKQDQVLSLYNSTRLFDNLGNEYGPSQASIANSSHNYGPYAATLSKQLIADISTKIIFTFRNVSMDTTSVTKLDIKAGDKKRGGFNVVYRNFALAAEYTKR